MTWESWKPRITRFTKIGFVALVVLFILAFIGFQYSLTPGFCLTCHYMKPYYDNWKSSKHKDVPCGDCHFPPGVQSELKGKFQAMASVAKYITRTYGTKPWAEVSDESCLREGCHEKRVLRGSINFKNTLFDHRPHLTMMKRGKKLRCTSCHSQIVQGSHMSVTESSCFLCHFKDLPRGEALGGCGACHGIPRQSVQFQGMRFDHSAVVERGVACKECHLYVTKGDGDVPKDRCVLCHAEPAKLEKYDDTVLMHENHVTKRKVECDQCHNTIQHGVVRMTEPITADCQGCHPNHHAAQREIYLGTGGKGTASLPSSMFLTSVTCNGCHIVHEGSEVTGTTLTAGAAACMSCHDERYGRVLDQWKNRMDSLLRLLVPAANRCRSEIERMGRAGRVTTDAEKLLSDAAYNIELVRYGQGVHNVEYADLLLKTARNQLAEAMKLVGSGYAPPSLGSTQAFPDSPCLTCHFGLETRMAKVFGKSFEHKKHTYACSMCHSEGVTSGQKGHGALRITEGECQRCHHKQTTDCATCHPIQKRVLTGTGVLSFEATPGPMSQNVACDACHVGLASGHDLNKLKKTCVDCHSPGYDEMVAGWQSDTRETLKEVRTLLAKTQGELRQAGNKGEPAARTLQAAEAKIRVVEQDGSVGAHNPALVTNILDSAREDLKSVSAKLK